VDEADIVNVKEGQRVTFTVDAFPNDLFSGKVTQVRLKSTVTSNVVTYQVVVNTPNKDLKLKPGLTANITIYTVEKNNVETMPNKVFSFRPDSLLLKKSNYIISENKEIGRNLKENERVLWIQDGNIIKNKSVEVGDADLTNTEIISGLSKNELVILDQKSLADDSGTSNDSSEKSPFMPSFKGRNGSKK